MPLRTALPRRLMHVTRAAAIGWVDDRASTMGAAIAYYTALSIAPLLVIVVAVVGLIYGEPSAAAAITEQFRSLIGDDGAQLIGKLLTASSETHGGTLSLFFGGAMLLVGATTVFSEVQADLDRIWKVEKPEKGAIRILIRTRLISFGLVLVVGFLLLVSLVVTAVIAALNDLLGPSFKDFQVLLSALNLVASIGIITVLFALIYKVLPSCDIRWRDVWIGAVLTASLFTAGKYLIGLYLGTVAFSSTFGAASAFVILLVWVYYAAQIFLFGAEFTYHFAQSHGSPADAAASPTPASPMPQVRHG